MNHEVDSLDQTVPADRVVQVMEEELLTGTRQVKTGSVRIRKKVHRLHRTVDIPTVRDVVDVTRREFNQAVSEMPRVREEGETLIIPVVEEEIVVTKRLILKEEIYVRRRRQHSTVTKDVTLGKEVATIERLDAEGNVVSSSQPATPTEIHRTEPEVRDTAPAPSLLALERKPLLTPDPAAQLRVKKGLLD